MDKFFTTSIALFLAILGLAGCAANTGTYESHAYGTVDVAEGEPVPTIEIEVEPDAVAGWNLHLIAENIEFAPERASTEHFPGEGHAHLYINGKMIARLYSKWYHITKLRTGRNQIIVTLNSNDHNAYSINGEVISATTVIEVEEEQTTDSGGSY